MNTPSTTGLPVAAALCRQRRFLRSKRVRAVSLFVGCGLIAMWQFSFLVARARVEPKYKMRASSGMYEVDKFTYFLYYTGLYPVATTIAGPPQSKEGAREILKTRGDTLLTEWGHTTRYGDLGKALLFLPVAYLKGSAASPSVIPFHAFLFTLSLILLYAGFWRLHLEILGAAAVLFVGSDPFQLFEVYGNPNVFGWPITTAILVLALHLPFLTRLRPRLTPFLWLVPVITGVALSSVRQIRTEPVAIILSAAVCYLFLSRTPWTKRLALLGLLVSSFLAANKTWDAYFDFKLKQAERIVREAGGTPYPGPRDRFHMFWHPIWCGLGDFDTKYGYDLWKDQSAANYAFPILREKYKVKLPDWDGNSLVSKSDFWDEGRKYYKTPYEIPHYDEVLRGKVVHDVTHDPLWFAGILARRMVHALRDTTPVSLAVGNWRIEFPVFLGFAFVPLVLFLLWMRSWLLLKVMLFTLPLSCTSILVYALRGTTYYAIFNLLTAAVLLALILEAFLRWKDRRTANND